MIWRKVSLKEYFCQKVEFRLNTDFWRDVTCLAVSPVQSVRSNTLWVWNGDKWGHFAEGCTEILERVLDKFMYQLKVCMDWLINTIQWLGFSILLWRPTQHGARHDISDPSTRYRLDIYNSVYYSKFWLHFFSELNYGLQNKKC